MPPFSVPNYKILSRRRKNVIMAFVWVMSTIHIVAPNENDTHHFSNRIVIYRN